jgi:hypothetical protein
VERSRRGDSSTTLRSAQNACVLWVIIYNTCADTSIKFLRFKIRQVPRGKITTAPATVNCLNCGNCSGGDCKSRQPKRRCNLQMPDELSLGRLNLDQVGRIVHRFLEAYLERRSGRGNVACVAVPTDVRDSFRKSILDHCTGHSGGQAPLLI